MTHVDQTIWSLENGEEEGEGKLHKIRINRIKFRDHQSGRQCGDREVEN